jgi:hypothetical protein
MYLKTTNHFPSPPEEKYQIASENQLLEAKTMRAAFLSPEFETATVKA